MRRSILLATSLVAVAHPGCLRWQQWLDADRDARADTQPHCQTHAQAHSGDRGRAERGRRGRGRRARRVRRRRTQGRREDPQVRQQHGRRATSSAPTPRAGWWCRSARPSTTSCRVARHRRHHQHPSPPPSQRRSPPPSQRRPHTQADGSPTPKPTAEADADAHADPGAGRAARDVMDPQVVRRQRLDILPGAGRHHHHSRVLRRPMISGSGGCNTYSATVHGEWRDHQHRQRHRDPGACAPTT